MEIGKDNPQSTYGGTVDSPEQNYGIGNMLYNNAMDKLIAANNVPADDKTGLSRKLNEESNTFFRLSIPYFKNAIKYYDGLKDNDNMTNRSNTYHCLTALNTVYIRLGLYDELKPIKARIEEYM